MATPDNKSGKTSSGIPKDDINVHMPTTYYGAGPTGTVWISDTEDRMMYGLNPKTGKMVGLETYPGFTRDYSQRHLGIAVMRPMELIAPCRGG